MVSCVEDIGNGKIRVHFGYENPNDHEVRTYSSWSRVYYNNWRSRIDVLNRFEPGIVDKAFYVDIDSDDKAEWVLRLSFWKVRRVTGDINSNTCEGGLPIIPGYNPPEGGKEYNSKIGAELTALYEAFSLDPNFSEAPDDIFQITGTKVLMEAVANSGQYNALITALSGLGVDLVISDADLNRVTGWVEIGDLLLLNDVDALHYARPVYPGVSNYTVPATGATNSQGDFSMHSDFARLGYDINGSGFKIGVLSNSYDTRGEAHIDIANGDLPGASNPNGFAVEVDVLKDIVPTQGALSDEGRAMLQIVHDIAPGAELAFRTGYLGEKDMARGIRELANSGTDVIVDDLSYITEPFFRDGVISQTIDSVVSEGVTFFSSAGNFGRSSYAGIFDPEVAPGTISGTAHDFSGDGDIYQEVLLREGSYMLVMQWDDGSDPSMRTTTTDLDLFLSDDAGLSLLGFNRENVGGFPIEVVPFSVEGDSVVANVVIARASGPESAVVNFKYILFRGGSQFEMLEYGSGSSTIVGHPNAAGAISVGAVRFDKNPIYNPSEFPVPVIMSFSSVGGTPVNGEVRAKPDITAPNGVNTTVDLGNGDWDSPIDPDVLFPNFFGTSAASPHAAGVAALIMEAKSKYDPEALVDPEYIRAVMKSTAIDMDDPGEDHISGSGFLQAHKAMMTFANPSPYVENLILASEGGVPGEEITPFSFTVTGDFFTESTQVLFRGEALESGVVVVDEGTITVDHPGFIGNPEVQVFNPSISTSGEDGGSSEGIYFSDPVKQTVIITANNSLKKYGEVLPAYSASYQLVTVDEDTLSLEEAVTDGIMLQAEADRLSGLAYNSPALESSNAGIYIIEPSLFPEVDSVSPSEIDHALSEKYILEFVNGNLSIEKLALTITPENVGMIYGELLPANGFDFLYEIGDSGVNIANLGLVLSEVEQEHNAAISNEIGLVRGVALVNGIPLIRGTALVNGVTMVRGVALVNGIEVKVEVEGSDTTVSVAGEPLVNGGSLIRGVALVNDRPLVSMTEIVRGVALVNGNEVSFDDGYMTELNGVPLENAVPAVRGIALVNGLNNTRGVALVNGHEVVIENGITTIDGQAVPGDGIALVNGIPVLRGVALVNSSLISRGIALVNGLEVAIENGIPTGRGIALVNGIPTSRGIALVNGIPLIRGTALVNNLEVHVLDGEVDEVYENGALVNGLSLSRGIALVNEVALVNGGQLINRGTALVNGIALADDEGDGEDLVDLRNMNFMASGAAIANGVKSLRGVALVNGIVGEDGQGLKIAAGTVQEDGSIVYESGITSRGVALVNGLNYVRGTALVNGAPLTVRGTALVNGSTVNDNSNSGTILVFDATELGDTTENAGFAPMSFVTGTTVGKHWIVPPTYISNNFDISYGLGTLNIDPANLSISAEDKSKTYGEDDPPLTYLESGLLGEDNTSGELIREEGEDVRDYAIRQGSVTAGENYTVHFDTAVFTIDPAGMTLSVLAEDKEYDGTRVAVVSLSDSRLPEDSLDFTYTSALFDDKNVGENKLVTVSDITIVGPDAGNYSLNPVVFPSAEITVNSINVTAVTDSKVYDGLTSSIGVPIVDPLMEGDIVSTVPLQLFDNRNVGIEKTLTASGLVIDDGNEGANYDVSYVNNVSGQITELPINVTAVADTKVYDGLTSSVGVPLVDPLMDDDDVATVPVQLFDNRNVGAGKTLTASGLVIDDGNGGANYIVSYVQVNTGEVTALPINVTAVADNKVYDGLASSIGVPLVDPLMGDDYASTVPVQLFDNKNVGTGKILTASGLEIDDGNDGNNYSVSYVNNETGQIIALAINVTAVTDSKVYDGSTTSLGVPVVDPLMGDDFASTDPAQLYDTKNAGAGKTLSASGLVIDDGNGGNNYAVNYVEVTTGIIDAFAIDVTAVTDSKTYDGTTSSDAVPELDALISGDLVETNPVQVFDNKNAGSGKTLMASGLVIDDGNGGNNYDVSYVEVTTGIIDAFAIDVTAVTDSKTYDGTTSSDGVPELGALISGDLVETNPVQVFDNRNAGSGKTLTASGLVIDDGNGGNNYTVNYVEVTNGVIDAIAINVTAVTDSKAYDGTTSSDGMPLVDLLMVGDEVDTEPGQVFDTRNAGTGKTLMASGLVIGDGNGGNNYLVNYVNDYTGSITQKEVYVTPLEDKFYIARWDPLPEVVFSYEGWIEGDEGDQGYTAIRESDGKAYNPNSNKSMGLYILTPVVSNANYSFQIETGLLQVNKHDNTGHNDDDDDKHNKSAAVSGAVADVEELASDVLEAYPNPVVDRVYLRMKDVEEYKHIQLYDFSGKLHHIGTIDKQINRLEIDMSKLSSGQYFIRVIMEDNRTQVVQLIKK